ncbi:hypothetical protein RU93_GL000689 [Enterococcus aquimarinus]|uniref:Uncharacterized protein n=1 Tax=Enterococcus aquimarinus TaxID=328396 RepID=A0A1L8QPW3_9ENTE|nr:hypothetical protein RU93_GL000689 [Enterococcus aquimarinus]
MTGNVGHLFFFIDLVAANPSKKMRTRPDFIGNIRKSYKIPCLKMEFVLQ